MYSREQAIFQLLSTNGDGTGTTDAIGDYSITPQSFKFSNIQGRAIIERMIVMIQDVGTFDADKYGNGLSLTNGIRLYLKDSNDSVLQEYTAFPILSNSDWAGHCHDLNHFAFGVGDEVSTIRWTFSKAGQPIIIDFVKGEYLEVYLNDDFTALVHQRFQIQGKYLYNF